MIVLRSSKIAAIALAAFLCFLALAACGDTTATTVTGTSAATKPAATLNTNLPTTAPTTANGTPASTSNAANTGAVPTVTGDTQSFPDGLKYIDSVVGTGATPQIGEKVEVNYVGYLTTGKKFDASADHGGTFKFNLGKGEVIKAWDEGVATMKIGGKRRLLVPAALGYGAAGAGNVIPPNSDLIFDIELLPIPTMPTITANPTATASGLKYIDTVVGTGATPQNGQTVTAKFNIYTPEGKLAFTTDDSPNPVQFALGGGDAPKGLEEGLLTMKVGGKRRLLVPAALGFGANGGGIIPPNSDVIIDVELLDAK